MSFANESIQVFDRLSEHFFQSLKAGEFLSLNLFAEDSDFVRFNAAKVRQNTHVLQKSVEGEFQFQKRTFRFQTNICGDFATDVKAVQAMIDRARKEVVELPEDPFQVPIANHGNSEEIFSGSLLPNDQIAEEICAAVEGQDFVGIYSGGPILHMNRNSTGQRHIFATENFSLDYSLFYGPKAVKGLYAGSDWDSKKFKNSVSDDAKRLGLLNRPAKNVERGEYRVYLAPAAVHGILELMGWGSLSQDSFKRGNSPLKKVVEGEVQLSPLFSLAENFGLGGSPRFNSLGEVAPVKTPLFVNGKFVQLLTSSRTAKEFSCTSNQADPGESPRSPEVAAGALAEKDILTALGTGLYLSNLHYLNWSDRVGARVTGMTRYACFWVENGEIAAPIGDLRFDESLFRIFGSELVAVTSAREFAPNTMTYERRQVGTSLAPGILLNQFKFTL